MSEQFKGDHEKKISIKIIFTVFMLWIAATGMSYAGADIMVDEPIFSFGSVVEGTQVTHDFIVRNPGDDVLSILRVATSCGCTVADYPKTVAPGETGLIHVKANTSGYAGSVFKRKLVIRTDAPEKKSVVLQIEGNVE